MGLDAIIVVFWMLNFKPAFSLSSFTFIMWLFSSSLSAIRVVSSAFVTLLIFLPAILIPACASSRLAFHMMYSALKLNKQGDNIQLCHTLFPNFEPVHCSMSDSNGCFLTCIQISQEEGKVVWYSHLLKNFPVCFNPYSQRLWPSQTEVDVFLELFCFFNYPADVGNLISGSSIFSKSSLNIWKFTVHVLLKPGLKNFEHYFARV